MTRSSRAADVGPSVKNLLAVIEHDDPVDDAHQHTHDVLDPNDRDAEPVADLLEHLCGTLHFRGIEPAEALIGKQQPRLGRECAGEFELFECSSAEPLGRRSFFGRQSNEIERPDGAALGFGAGDMAALGVVGRQCHIFAQAELAEWARDLKGPSKPEPAHPMGRRPGDLPPFEPDRAGRRRQ